jgi:ABC-type multidrug transport system fused ATPase/permease subunit
VDVETQMTSVERVLEYSSLEQESQSQISGNSRPPTDWPSRGEIVYENVSMKHLPGEGIPLALNNISFTINAGERVGIVGRTGAGKTSSIHTLFRMGFLTNGRVIIDGIDIATIDLKDLRERISIIPQDPVLFSGTLRFNLDPFNRWSDEEILNALEKVCT